MRSIPSIETLTFENLQPGTEVEGIERLEDFDRLAVFTGAVLLDNLSLSYPNHPIVDPQDTIMSRTHPEATLANKLTGVAGELRPIALGAVFVESTYPSSAFFVHGAHANFVSTVQISRDLIASLETSVYVEDTHPAGQTDDHFIARKKFVGDVRLSTKNQYIEWVNRILQPRMRAKSLTRGKHPQAS